MNARARTQPLSLRECAALALLLHLMVLLVIEWNVRGTVLAVPVRSLNIRLGAAEETPPPAEMQMMAAAAPAAGQAIVPPPEEPVAISQADLEKVLKHSTVAPKPAPKTPPAVSKQFVRPEAKDKAMHVGSELGNSTAENAEEISRYEQLLSLWLLKHRVYPAQAREQGVSGEALVRLRIDRKGNIRFSRLEKSAGAPILDEAVREMIRTSNPVPVVPGVYPGGDLVEFLIPVTFR